MSQTIYNHFISRKWPTLVTMVLSAVMMMGLGLQIASAAPGNSAAGAQDQLISDTKGAVTISRDSVTGLARFVRFPKNAAMPPSLTGGASALAASDSFFNQYGGVFGITNPANELAPLGAGSSNTAGGTQLSFQQIYKGVPVFAAVLKARFDSNNQLTSINGNFVAGINVRTMTADLTSRQGNDIAIRAVAAQIAAKSGEKVDAAARALDARNNQMYVFRSGLVQGVAGKDHLVYEVEVANSKGSVREFVYVSAHTGAVVDQITGIHDALDREVSETSLANVIWDESNGDPDPIPAAWAGGTAQQVTDWQNEIDGARETYNVFSSMTAGAYLSYDAADATMRTVNNDPGISCPNANWNGTSTNYCSGVTGDDTVAHEWGHAYTDYTSGLIYAWQSGALNESYSDIWGEVVDFLNARGTDAPDTLRSAGGCSIYGAGAPSVDDSYRWLSGEDDPAFGGAIRDMWEPNCYGDPGSVTDPIYWCSTLDSGGVHINSGIPNHAFALMVDGGTFNSIVITGIGLTKAAHIHWGAQNILTPASNFQDQADALEQSCSDLIGVDLNALDAIAGTNGSSGEVITVADCDQVANAVDAVEFRTVPTQCNFVPMLDPDAPALCEGFGSVQGIASEDFEDGVLPAGWMVGSHHVASPPTFDTPFWDVVDGLPAGASGAFAAFVPDILLGDCAADDESGAVNLDSPIISLPAGEVPHVAFDHWVSTELGWDGGNVKVSVNGGAWTLIPSGAYSFNPYNQALNGAGNTNPLAGEEAFTGGDGGSVGGSWGQSQIDLYGLAFPGDDVQIRFDFGVDGCNGAIGWYVDDFEVYSCSDEELPICGDGMLDLGEMCDDGNMDDGDGCSSVCQVESGFVCSDPTPPTSGLNVIDDGSFEAGAFGGTWNEFSLNFGTPVCDVGSCGTGTGTGPSDGAFWVWFGGIAAYEEGSVSQSVNIPSTATDLTFDLEQIVCDSGDDYVELLVDGNQEFFSDGNSAACGTLGYATQTVDLSAYADDGSHTIDFHSEIFATNFGGTNFFVDDVYLSNNQVIPGSPSVCRPIQNHMACNVGTVGFEAGLPSEFSVTDNTGLGLVWTNVAGSGEDGNYTGGEDDAGSVSSDRFGPADFDTELVSNIFSLSISESASLDYLANYQNFAAFDFLDLDISTDGGSNWTNLLSWNEDHGSFRGAPGEAVAIDLTPYAGMDNLQLRWRYYDPTTFDWDWYAQVDDIALSCEIPVVIDIMSKAINMKKEGVIPVAILGSDTLDVTLIDPLSVAFGPDGATASHGTGHLEYVDGDGYLDLMMHFESMDTGIVCGDTSASLTGMTYDGQPFEASDTFKTTGCN